MVLRRRRAFWRRAWHRVGEGLAQGLGAGRIRRMNPQPPNPSSPSTQEPGANNFVSFGAQPPERTPAPLLPWVVAGLVVVLVALAAVFLGERHPGATPKDAREQNDYAQKLAFSDLKMSESTSLSGGKSTFVDGRVRNTGDRIVSGATVQVAFGNDEALPPQVITLPLTLIRAHEPYVDTVPLNESPLVPGSEREFRLIFEGIGANWNQQMPAMRVTQVLIPCNPCR